MNIERQRQIIKERHNIDLHLSDALGLRKVVVYRDADAERISKGKVSTIVVFCERASPRGDAHIYSNVSGFRGRILHNFVAAVTYAKAELARIERLNAAKEKQ